MDDQLFSSLPSALLSRFPELAGRRFAPGTVILPGFNDQPADQSGSMWSMIQSLLPLISSFLGGKGISMPILAGTDQNVYDSMLRQRRLTEKNRALQAAAAMDQQNLIRLFRGVANMTGVPWGIEQQAAAETLLKNAIGSASLAAQYSPDFMDVLGGRRGSALALTSRMIDLTKRRIDPITGMYGVSPQFAADLSRQIYTHFFDVSRTSFPALSAGQMGSLLVELQNRGLIGSTVAPDMPGFAGRLAGSARELVRVGRTAELETLISAARSVGIDLGRTPQEVDTSLKKIQAEDLDKIFSMPEARAVVRAGDAQKYIRAINRYQEVIDVMREIFGEGGRPGAPIPNLIQALDHLTGGGMTSMDPSKLRSFASRLRAVQTSTGTDLLEFTRHAQMATAVAESMGLSPTVGPQLLLDSQLRLAAFRSSAPEGAFPGRLTDDQFLAATQRGLTSALASRASGRLAALEYYYDLNKDRLKGTDLERAIEAYRKGEDRFVDKEGRLVTLQDLVMNDRSAMQLLERSGINVSTVTFARLRDVLGPTYGDLSKRAQTIYDFQRQEVFENRLMQEFESLSTSDLVKQAAGDKSLDLVKGFVRELQLASPEDIAQVGERRTSAIRDILVKAASASGLKLSDEQLTAILPDFEAVIAHLTKNQNLIQMLQQYRPDLTKLTRIEAQKTEITEAVQNALQPLSRGSLGRRVVENIISAGPGTGILEILEDSLFIPNETKTRISEIVDQLKKERSDLEEEISKKGAIDPDRMRSKIEAIRSLASQLSSLVGKYDITEEELGGGKASEWRKQLEEMSLQPYMMTQVLTGYGSEVMDEEVQEFISKHGKEAQVSIRTKEDLNQLLKVRAQSILKTAFKAAKERADSGGRIPINVLKEELEKLKVTDHKFLQQMFGDQTSLAPEQLDEYEDEAARRMAETESERLFAPSEKGEVPEAVKFTLRTPEEVKKYKSLERERLFTPASLAAAQDEYRKRFAGADDRDLSQLARLSAVVRAMGRDPDSVIGNAGTAKAAIINIKDYLLKVRSGHLAAGIDPNNLQAARDAIRARRDRASAFIKSDSGQIVLQSIIGTLRETEQKARSLMSSDNPFLAAQGKAMMQDLNLLRELSAQLGVPVAELIMGQYGYKESMSDEELKSFFSMVAKAEAAIPGIMSRLVRYAETSESAFLTSQAGLLSFVGPGDRISLRESELEGVTGAKSIASTNIRFSDLPSEVRERIRRVDKSLAGLPKVADDADEKTRFARRFVTAAARHGLHSDAAMKVLFGSAWSNLDERKKQIVRQKISEGSLDFGFRLDLTSEAAEFFRTYGKYDPTRDKRIDIAGDHVLRALVGAGSSDKLSEEQMELLGIISEGGASPEAALIRLSDMTPEEKRALTLSFDQMSKVAQALQNLHVRQVVDRISDDLKLGDQEKQLLEKKLLGKTLDDAQKNRADDIMARWRHHLRQSAPSLSDMIVDINRWTGSSLPTESGALDESKVVQLHKSAKSVVEEASKQAQRKVTSVREAMEILKEPGREGASQDVTESMETIKRYIGDDFNKGVRDLQEKLQQPPTGVETKGTSAVGQHITISGELVMKSEGVVHLEGSGRVAG